MSSKSYIFSSKLWQIGGDVFRPLWLEPLSYPGPSAFIASHVFKPLSDVRFKFLLVPSCYVNHANWLAFRASGWFVSAPKCTLNDFLCFVEVMPNSPRYVLPSHGLQGLFTHSKRPCTTQIGPRQEEAAVGSCGFSVYIYMPLASLQVRRLANTQLCTSETRSMSMKAAERCITATVLLR